MSETQIAHCKYECYSLETCKLKKILKKVNQIKIAYKWTWVRGQNSKTSQQTKVWKNRCHILGPKQKRPKTIPHKIATKCLLNVFCGQGFKK